MRLNLLFLVCGFLIFGSLGTMFGLWYLMQSFIPWDPNWWVWLIKYILFYQQFPEGMFYSLVITLFIVLAAGMSIPLSMRNPSSSITSGNMTLDKVHGSAEWATAKDIKIAGLVNDEGVTVGGYGKKPLRHDGPEHVIGFAPTRSGKGVSLVLPTLLEWHSSVVVLDIKGENYALTAGYRQSLGHKIFRFEPTAEEGSAKFNPLAEIRMGTDNQLADCQNIAIMIIDPDGKGLKDFWMQSGFEWLSAAILHILFYVKNTENRLATLTDVNRILSGGDPTKDPKEVSDEPIVDLLKFMISYDHKDTVFDTRGNSMVDEHVRGVASAMFGKAAPERSGVHSSCKTQLALYGDSIISRNIMGNDFRINDLMNSEVPVALYIIIPPSDIDRLRPLIRVIFNIMLRRLTSSMEFEGGRSVQGYKHRLLLMLDEFTSVGKLDIFEKALAFMSGYGIKCFIIVQDLSQLQQAYGKEESIMSNCHIRIAFAPNKIETAKVLSDMLGKITVIQEKRSVSGRFGSSSPSDSVSEQGRPLMNADEIMKLPGAQKNRKGDVTVPGKMLIFVAGFPAVLGNQRLYFMDKVLLARAKMPYIHGFDIKKITAEAKPEKKDWFSIFKKSAEIEAEPSLYNEKINELKNAK